MLAIYDFREHFRGKCTLKQTQKKSVCADFLLKEEQIQRKKVPAFSKSKIFKN